MTSQPQLRLALRNRGVLVHEQEVSSSQCIEDAYFRAVIAGDLANDGLRPPVTVTPRWLPEGEPGVAELVVRLEGVDEDFVYGTAVFADLAATAITRLLGDNRGDQAGDDNGDETDDSIDSRADLDWTIEARWGGAEAPPSRFRSRVLRQPYPLTAGSLAPEPRGTLTVRIQPEVIGKGRAEVLANPTAEVAGLLLGRLVHDAQRGIAEVVVRDYVALTAGEGGASRAHFAFGPNTFAEARAALRKSRSEEDAGLVSVGWLHTHPPCEQCFSKTDCPAQTVFFSQDDVRVHASAFAAPFNVALVWGKVANAPATRPGFRIYCWYRGRVVDVDYRSEQPAAALPKPTAAATASP